MKKGQPNVWQGSTQWRMISREAIKDWNAKRGSLPKCGARRKRDGEPCQQLAQENGRCHFHGGRTGKGAKFHVHILPNGDAPDFEAKLQRKFKQIERDRKTQAKRRAAMSPKQLEAHQAWQEAHQPGSAAARTRDRLERQYVREIQANLGKLDERPITPELAELQAQAAHLEAERDRYRAMAMADQTQTTGNGVFD